MRFFDIFIYQWVLKTFRRYRSWLNVGALSLILMGLISPVQADIITTVAGEGVTTNNIYFYEPTGVAVDSSGNFYIANSRENQVHKVDTNGSASTVAGTYENGYSGDGGAATDAQLSYPINIAVDSSGNLYIADQYNHRIRKVDKSGIINTVAGDGTYGYSGDGAAATSAKMRYPAGVAVDSSGNLYIADMYNHRIRKVATNGIISTVAGSGTAGNSGDGGAAISASLNYPYGIAVDSSGNLYIADTENHSIRKVGTNGVISTVAGIGTFGYHGDGGAATSAALTYPTSVAIDSSGNLYIADQYNHRIRKVDTSGIISTVAGTGTFGGYYHSGSYDNGDGGAAINAQLSSPEGVAVDSSGNLYIADTFGNRIRKVELGTNAPTFTSTAITSVNKDTLYSYSITTHGVNGGNSLTITAPTTPTWLSLTDNGDGTATLSGTPTDSEIGTHNVILRVNDGTANVDQSFSVTVSAACMTVTEIPQIECRALAALYHSSDGANWTTNTTDWLATDTPCTWSGVTCDSGHVSQLYFHEQLTGSIPAEIGNLTNLSYLALWNNQLTSIPAAIGNLTSLTSLNLGNNQLSTLPAEIGNLTNLSSIDLSSNQLTSIPAAIGNLTSLTSLNLGGNQLSTLPAEIWNLTNLSSLELWNNQLTSIPAAIANLTSLTSLNLGDNQLSTLPAEIWNLTNLSSLNLYHNQLTSIPAAIANLTSLSSLNLRDNQLTSIPLEIWNLTNLDWLNLEGNQLTGSIPAAIGNLTNLVELHLGNNQLTGSIPTEIGNLASLRYILLYGNQLTGSIPAEIGNLANLDGLNLGNNQLTGSIPEIGNLTNLDWFYLNKNQLTGTIPSELENLSDLSYGMDLSCNLLTIPTSQSFIDFIDVRQGHSSSYFQKDYWKTTQDGTCPTAPSAATLLNATVVSQTQINLSWTDNSADETGFKVERDVTLVIITAANVTSYSDTGLTCGTTYNYSVKATNAIGDSSAVTVSATTPACSGNPPANNPPTFTSTAVISVDKDALYTYNIITNDIDTGDSLVISAPTKPAWLNFTDNGNGTATLNGTPTEIGTYNVTLRVNDGTVDVDQSFTLTVNTNTLKFSSTPITSVDKNSLYHYDITAKAVNTADQLTLTALTKPTWLNFTDNGDGTALLSGTPTEAEIGFHTITLQVSDGTLNVEQNFTMSVDDVAFLDGITLKCTGCPFNNAALATVESQPGDAGNYEFPAGLVSFEVDSSSNPSAVVSVFYNNINQLDNFIYRKYGPTTPGDSTTADWYTFNTVTIGLDTLNGQSVVKASLTLSDGQLGDDTGVDGSIIDPGGIARDATSSPTPPPTGSYSSGGVNTQCTSQGNTVSSSCNAGEQTFTGEVEVKENASVAQATFEDDVDNKGMISNSTIGPDATLTGGKLTGTIINEGIIADVNFVGAKLSGGTLSGTVVNNSKVGGVIKDVQLAGGMVLKGGRLGGEISGDPDDPALITDAKILPGSVLSNVRISPTVQLPENVVLGPGVILPSTPPTLADFGLEREDIANLDAETLSNLEPAVFGTLSAEEIKLIPPEAFAALEPAQIAEIQKEALEGMTTEQFEQMPIATLDGLTSENMGGLSTEVIAELTPEHLDALDAKEFKAMPSEDVSKLFVNFDDAKITPQNAEKLVPKDWQLDVETGALTAPIGAKVTFQKLSPTSTTPGTSTSTNVGLPQVANLSTGFGVGGNGTPLMEDTKHSLEEEDLKDLVLSQDEYGILRVESTEDPDVLYTFIPDTDNAIVVNTEKMPIGLSVGAGGFYTITTPEGIQYRVVPAPQNPVALSQSIGGGEVVVGKRGDILVELPTQARRGGARQVVIMDPFVEPDLSDTCVEMSPGVVICDDVPSGPRSSTRRDPVPRLKVAYPDGTAQAFLPTLLDPDMFTELALQLEDVDSVVFNADGTFYMSQKGQKYRVFPNYNVTTTLESEEEPVEASVVLNDDSTLRYTIAIEPLEETDNTRQGRRGAREVVIFDPFIEPILDDTCVEMSPGEVVCDPLW